MFFWFRNFSVAIVIIIFFYFYGIIGIELFSGVQTEDCCSCAFKLSFTYLIEVTCSSGNTFVLTPKMFDRLPFSTAKTWDVLTVSQIKNLPIIITIFPLLIVQLCFVILFVLCINWFQFSLKVYIVAYLRNQAFSLK